MTKVGRHTLGVGDIIQRKLADPGLHLQQQGERLANAASSAQERHLAPRLGLNHDGRSGAARQPAARPAQGRPAVRGRESAEGARARHGAGPVRGRHAGQAPARALRIAGRAGPRPDHGRLHAGRPSHREEETRGGGWGDWGGAGAGVEGWGGGRAGRRPAGRRERRAAPQMPGGTYRPLPSLTPFSPPS